jgi:4-amino-4-deoxy-L-arabinose transferase-like glycosyltransferase
MARSDTVPDMSRSRALAILAGITILGAVFRFYNLGWAAPFYHFQIDEHSVMGPADAMRRSMQEAVDFPKFFMYSPLLMYLVNGVRSVYEALAHPLDLSSVRDQVTYMVMGRAISATLGTLTIPIAYAIGTRISGRRAGLLGAALLACSVLHLRDSHFATTDISVTFFCALTLWLSLRLADRGDWLSLIGCGAAFGLTIVTKYSGAFVLGVVGIAYVMAPGRPAALTPVGRWMRWVVRGLVPIVVAAVVFVALNPLPFQYPEKFKRDLQDWVINPLTGATTYAWLAQFADVTYPRLYWFTNLMWWSFGPLLEITGVIAVAYLLAKRSKAAALAAAYAILYFLAAGGTIAPFIRYMLPLAPALAIGAGVLLSDGIRHPRWRGLMTAIAAITVGTTALYACAYMNVFRQPDSRLAAAAWIEANVPAGASVMVEPAQNTPPMGSYFHHPDFNTDYLLRTNQTRLDRYQLSTLDVYNRLFNQRIWGDGRDTNPQAYIDEQLHNTDWIVIDDTNVQNYQHLPEAKYHVVKQYYRNLLAGSLGFKLEQTFKVYPSLFGVTINDDGAELTFRIFDHPRVYVFHRSRTE